MFSFFVLIQSSNLQLRLILKNLLDNFVIQFGVRHFDEQMGSDKVCYQYFVLVRKKRKKWIGQKSIFDIV